MANVKGRRAGGADSRATATVNYYDEGDGTYTMAEASHNRLWDAVGLTWIRNAGDAASGAAKVILVGGTAAIGGVTVADGANVVEGALADLAVTTDANGTLSGKLRGLVKLWAAGMPAALGQGTMAQSLKVVIASDQASYPVAATLAAETTKVIGTVNQGTSPWVVGGNVASGGTDSGNPEKVGAIYNSTPPTFLTGQRADAQVGSRGSWRCELLGSNSGTAIGSATATDALANQFGLAALALAHVYNGASWDRIRTPTIFKTVAAVAITAGTGATIWTPAVGKKFRLMGFSFSASAAASLIFGDNAVGTVIYRTPLLAAAGVTQGGETICNGILSAAANNVLKLDVSANATVTGTVWGTEE